MRNKKVFMTMFYKSGIKKSRTGILKKSAACILVACAMLSLFPTHIMADDVQYRMNTNVVVDGVDKGYIPAFDFAYENNLYISLKGLARCLSGTDKVFSVSVDKKSIAITTGSTDEAEISSWSDEEISAGGKANAVKHELFINDVEKKYHSVILPRDNGYDAFMNPLSISLMLDLNISVDENKVDINTSRPYAVSMKELEESGYLQGVNTVLTGDGSTGEIFYGYRQDDIFPIASTTKLMTYFVFMDLVSEGKCSLDDHAVISDKAAVLSKSPDGAVPLSASMSVPVKELLYGMLLPSSNECALTIAEYAAGSEEAFVELMNEKAAELSLENTEFYNCHGLPNYEDQLYPAKMQNHMTAAEMFKMASALVNKYPQITDITATKMYHLDAIGKDVKNTNALLYNMDNAVGLKTGSTGRAGACLVTCVKAEKDGQTHDLITVLFGAEEDAGRVIVSEIAARYGLEMLENNASGYVPDVTENNDSGIPDDPEIVIKKLISMIGE